MKTAQVKYRPPFPENGTITIQISYSSPEDLDKKLSFISQGGKREILEVIV